MKRVWEKIAKRVDAATLRERGLIFVALVALVVALADTVLIDPEFTRQKRLNREIAQRQGDIAALQVQLNKLIAVRQVDPDRANRDRLARIRGEIKALEERLNEQQRRFTRPEQMRSVLEEMLGRNRKVSLVDMKTLQLAPIAEARAAAAAPPSKPAATKPAAPLERQVYRHGVELTVAGPYLDLLAYVSDLEKLPMQLYWGGAEMSAATYPVVTLKLTVYTLSVDKAWMNV